MRCWGLTTERRRCENESVDGNRYCENHRAESAAFAPLMNSETSSGVIGIFDKWRGKQAHYAIPDDARLGVPGWLKKLSTETVIDHLLHDRDSMRRWFAAFALRKRRDPVAIEPLWYALTYDVFSMVRQQSAVALGKMGTPTVQNPLIEALWHDPDAGVRQACAIALGNLGHPMAARDLAEVLTREYAAFVRWDCALALGQIGDDSHTSLLNELASKDRTEVVRNACREALAEIEKRNPNGL